jgi:hypothetical protein
VYARTGAYLDGLAGELLEPNVGLAGAEILLAEQVGEDGVVLLLPVEGLLEVVECAMRECDAVAAAESSGTKEEEEAAPAAAEAEVWGEWCVCHGTVRGAWKRGWGGVGGVGSR